MKCKVYVNGEGIEIHVDMLYVLNHWYVDPKILLDEVRKFADIGNVEFRNMKIYERYNVEKSQVVIGYLVENELKHEHVIFIVCAENPDELYAKTRIERSNWRDYEQYVYYKATVLGNLVNKEGVEEFEEAFLEVIELLNDLIDATPFFYCKDTEDFEKLKELSIRSAFQFAISNIAFPLANAVLYDLVGGNLVACFMQLRLILEALVKSLDVDYGYRFKDINVKSITEWEEYNRSGSKTHRTFSSIIESLCGKNLLNGEACDIAKDLWKRLSEEWVHFRGYADKIVKRALEYRDKHMAIVPLYMWVMPIDIDSDLKPELHDLYEYVSLLRKLLREIYNAWLKLLAEYDADVIKKCYKPLK